MADTNPFASLNGGQVPAQAQAPMRSPTQGVASIVQALVNGNQAYKDNQAKMAGAGSQNMDGQFFGNSSVGGAPLAGQPGVTPINPTDPSMLAQGAGSSVPVAPTPPAPAPVPQAPGQQAMGGQPDMSGAMGQMGQQGAQPMMDTMGAQAPIDMDPVTQALMSPIPGY